MAMVPLPQVRVNTTTATHAAMAKHVRYLYIGPAGQLAAATRRAATGASPEERTIAERAAPAS